MLITLILELLFRSCFWLRVLRKRIIPYNSSFLKVKKGETERLWNNKHEILLF